MPNPHADGTVRTESDIIRDHRREGRKETDPACVRECLATVRAMMSFGWDEDTMCVEFGVTAAKLAQYRRTILSKEQATLSHRPAEELFIEYRLMAMEDVLELDDIARKAAKAKNWAAATTARRARSQIIDQIMNRGQDMGVIPRAAKRHEVVGGLVLAQLSERELLHQIEAQAVETQALIRKFGGAKFTSMPARTDLYSDDIIVLPEAKPSPVAVASDIDQIETDVKRTKAKK